MSRLSTLAESVLVSVDIQPTFLAAIQGFEAEVLPKCKFLAECARLLEVPILATEQYATRMGPTHGELLPLLGCQPIDKMPFSCAGSAEFRAALEVTGRRQVVLMGAETHICIAQTGIELLEAGYQVFLPADAISGRGAFAREVAFRRLQAAGAELTHSESVVYEWMRTAAHPKFKEVLKVVKAAAG